MLIFVTTANTPTFCGYYAVLALSAKPHLPNVWNPEHEVSGPEWEWWYLTADTKVLQ